MEEKHLWDTEHPYYCNEGNYFAKLGECGQDFGSWGDFVSTEGSSDLDLNLVFRFDWVVRGDDDCKRDPHPDENYRADKLKLFYMGQRKGLYRYVVINVCRADEPQVREWLLVRYKHLLKLWTPISSEL